MERVEEAGRGWGGGGGGALRKKNRTRRPMRERGQGDGNGSTPADREADDGEPSAAGPIYTGRRRRVRRAPPPPHFRTDRRRRRRQRWAGRLLPSSVIAIDEPQRRRDRGRATAKVSASSQQRPIWSSPQRPLRGRSRS